MKTNALSLRIGLLAAFASLLVVAPPALSQHEPSTFKNPILSGFSPDPTLCRVGEDFYMVNSSFTWFPALPIYHSIDLVNWELIGHGVTKMGKLNFDGIKARDGVWAPTLRYHDGLFYLIATAYTCGGNFFVTAKNPSGPWSDPVWLKDAPGIDPSLFWDTDGTCYYTGNIWGLAQKQVGIWIQKLDLKTHQFIGERKILTYGHAVNANYAEGPHIYRVGDDYLLMHAEGGTDQYHAVVVHHSKSVMGDYVADKINPVLTHRHLGKAFPIQAVGHTDLVQTQNGEWWSVALAKRLVEGEVPMARETFLCKVVFEDGTPIFNPGYGRVLTEQTRPNLPWTPFKQEPPRDEFDRDSLSMAWHTVGTPLTDFYTLCKGWLNLDLKAASVDSLKHASVLLRRIPSLKGISTAKMTFQTNKDYEQAGLIVHRNNDSYFLVLKAKDKLLLIRKVNGKKELLAEFPYKKPTVYLQACVDTLRLQFRVGATFESLTDFGSVQTMAVVSENRLNRFNGPGIGLYATANGKISKNKASFDWFDHTF